MKVSIIDFGKFKNIAEEKIKNAMSDCLDIAKKEIIKRTPEDTGKLIDSYKIEEPKRNGDKIIGRIINEIPYGIYVEYGVKSKTYNYYKNGGRRKGAKPFYRGVGARMLTKTRDYKMEEFKRLFLIKIGKGKK